MKDPEKVEPTRALDDETTEATMEKTFEQKAQIVASAFYNRFDEEGESEILIRIFESHDLAGAIALAFVDGDIELKSDASRIWIEDTFDALDAVFEFPDEIEMVEIELTNGPKNIPANTIDT